MKNIVIHFLNGFCHSIAITLCVDLFVLVVEGRPVMLPEFVGRFESESVALLVQLLLVGLMSGVTAAGTEIFQLKRPGLWAQSVLFLLLMLATWIPVACYVWGFHKYVMSMVSTLASIVVTYGICWGIQYKLCRRDVEEINQRLGQKEM